MSELSPSTSNARCITSPVTFRTDQVVAERFRIVGFLAQGGMGEVYEAEDLDLGVRVAIKTLRPEIALDPKTLQRFKREISLARKVTHPHVCRIFDLFHHKQEYSPDLLFLAMELVQGPTLAQEIARSQRLKPSEALPILVQIASGLDAAHHAGVIHRDFKSSNVLLDRSSGFLRAVITDFGLARSASPEDPYSSTATPLVGTSAYMAPEQVEGSALSHTADIYALGVVLYEMVTGTKPFLGETPLSTAMKRLKEPPTSPRVHVADLDPRWEGVILKCLERDPKARFSSAGAAIAALSDGSPLQSRIRLKRVLIPVLSLTVLIATFLGYTRFRVQPQINTSPQAIQVVHPRRSIALLGFKNLSGQKGTLWLSTALAEMLTTELSAGEKLRAIPGENVARMKIDLALADTDTLAHDTLGKVRSHLGSDLVVLGSYLTVGPKGAHKIRLDLKVQDTSTGETVVSLSESGSEEDLFILVSQTGVRLREQLGLHPLSAQEATALRASKPKDPRAAQLYAEGLLKLRRFDALAAKDVLTKAAVVDPSFPLAHSALAEAWATLGYDQKAKDAAKKALDLSSDLPREERLLVEGRYREVGREWDKATEIYRTLFEFFPDNLEYGLHLAQVQTSAGKPKDALVTIAALRKLPQPTADDPRIDLAHADAEFTVSNYERQLAIAQRAMLKAQTQSASLLVAKARLLEGRAFWERGQHEQAIDAYRHSEELYKRAGDQRGMSVAQANIAMVYWQQGDLQHAKPLFEKALAVSNFIGDARNVARVMTGLAATLNDLGDPRGLDLLYQQLEMAREQGNLSAIATAHNNLGVAFEARGELPRSQQAYSDAYDLFLQVGERAGVTMALANLGGIIAVQGDLRNGHDKLVEAVELGERVERKVLAPRTIAAYAEVLHDMDRLNEATRLYEKALGMQHNLSEPFHTARHKAAYARTLIEAAKWSEAENVVGQAIAEASSVHNLDAQARCQAELARCFILQGRVTEAHQAVARMQTLLPHATYMKTKLIAAIASGTVKAQARDWQGARRDFERAIETAESHGYFGFLCEARLAFAEMEIASGRVGATRGPLEALERDARAKGFLLIARKAAAARQKAERTAISTLQTSRSDRP